MVHERSGGSRVPGTRSLTFPHLLGLAVLAVAAGCRPAPSTPAQTDCTPREQPPLPRLDYAVGIEWQAGAGYRRVVVPEPWPGAAKPFTLILLECGANPPAEHSGEALLRVPVDRVATTAAVQVAQLAALGVADVIVAHAGRDLIWAPEVRTRREAVVELGANGPIELEHLVRAEATVLLSNPLSAADDFGAQIAPLGVVVIPYAEWLEPHPVARAEWISLLAAVVGREAAAEELMENVREGWASVVDQTSALADSERPGVFTGLPWRGTWWVPPTRSATAELVRAAGGRWVLENLPSAKQQGAGNLPVDLEAMVAVAGAAEVWLGPGLARSRTEILAAEPRARLFHALERGLVLVPDLRLGESGANDWWEGAVVRPDQAVAELAAALHPRQFSASERRWLRTLEGS